MINYLQTKNYVSLTKNSIPVFYQQQSLKERIWEPAVPEERF